MDSFDVGLDQKINVINKNGILNVSITENGKKKIDLNVVQSFKLCCLLRHIDDSIQLIHQAKMIRFRNCIGSNKFVTVSSQHKTVDIRQFKNHGYPRLAPSKEGISFHIERWSDIKKIIEHICEIFSVACRENVCELSLETETRDSITSCYRCNDEQIFLTLY
jgi:hypothetical protein